MKCPHCKKDINPAALLGSLTSALKTEKNGENAKRPRPGGCNPYIYEGVCVLITDPARSTPVVLRKTARFWVTRPGVKYSQRTLIVTGEHAQIKLEAEPELIGDLT